MTNFTITPKVDASQEFIEIAMDFANPLDLVREAISNAFDADATKIRLMFDVINNYGERELEIEIADNGHGMDAWGLESFFDLGNSLRRGDSDTIGEKGHGTKIFFNSTSIEVVTIKSGVKYRALMKKPKKFLYSHKIPPVEVESEQAPDAPNGTVIKIFGYNSNRRDKFTHMQLKDYITWFSKFGSVEREFGIDKNCNVILEFKGVDKSSPETLTFGHVFPRESEPVNKLFNQYTMDAPKYYCKKFIDVGSLRNYPEIKYHAVFYVEGLKVRYAYNPMIRHSGYSAPVGAYTVQERYGLWLCKDFMPIQRKNEWITHKGSEYTKFHAFVNCQALKLTANRGSVENTPSEILQDLQEVVRNLYDKITSGSDWDDMIWLEDEVDAYRTVEKEKSEFERRIDKINRTEVAEFNGLHLVAPRLEAGVFSIFLQLSNYNPAIFPFSIVDYDTHTGIDVIAKSNDAMPIKSSKLYYVEFKNYLGKNFNHSFQNLHSIVCWDINLNEIRHNDEIIDIAKDTRTLTIIPPSNFEDYTHYYLDDLKGSRKIEIFVLKSFLREKLGIEFKPRTKDSTY